MAPPNDASTREVLFCRPDSRHVYTHFGIRSEDVADGDTWATSLVSNMQRSLAMGGHRLRRITVRDAVVARALRRVGGMECPGTVIEVVGPEDTVNGTPLVSRMDGLYAQNHMQSLPDATYQQMLDPRARADAAVRESSTRPGRYTLDRGDEERTVPGMSWACGGCRRLMRRDVDTPKRCAGCSAVHYCGTECQREDWRRGHKVECKALQIKGVH
uniref:MYND-type domain-containing protein n=1 Tax=Mantoniella antarctica TaxID=81844 RepID=A0A7S0SR23_9CHLO